MDSILITTINGKSNVVTFRYTADSIINEFYSQPHSDDSYVEKLKIVQTAVKLLQSDTKRVEQQRDIYPDACQMSSLDECLGYLPETLHILLQYLFVGKNTDKERASIGQAMMQATRPRVLVAPLQLGLAVQMRHHFASRFLVDSAQPISWSPAIWTKLCCFPNRWCPRLHARRLHSVHGW